MTDLLAGAIILEDSIVPARAPWSARLQTGDNLRLVDMEGGQAVDFLCFNSDDPSERYHAANTIKLQHNIYIGEGTVLQSSRARPMMTVVTDTCGRHDTIYGCCSFELDDIRYGKHNAASCQSNFETELSTHGLGPEHIVANVNWFMNVPVEENGDTDIVTPRSQPGDHIDLRAEMPLIAVLSNCPEELNLACGDNGPTPIRAIVYRPTPDL
ncbi:MAG: urea carboxylase-associated family protein [Rhodobacteraceae bacterium]|nr:urea carboxylase-associated family protein [Paracoccaceae bacterium]